MDDSQYGCEPAASVLGVDASSIDCDGCPFPFCVTAEAHIIRVELREHLARIMQRLGDSVQEIAKSMDVTTRSVYRYKARRKTSDCILCNQIHSQDVMCKSDTYTVVCSNGQHMVILNKHRRATARELVLVKCFTEYAFPSSIMDELDGGHDHWALSRVELKEAKNFERMCDALSQYTLSLSRGAGCPQQVR